MTEFIFFKESPLDNGEYNGVRSRTWSNVCVVGLDGKGWTSGTLLSCLSPWMKDLLTSLPPHPDHCIILPDIPWKQITAFFKLYSKTTCCFFNILLFTNVSG